jgi:putative transposase
MLSVDLEIKTRLAVDSDGEIHPSQKIRDARMRSDALKVRLQQSGIKSAKRHLKKRSGRMARFTKDVNHQTSKILITKANDTCSLIALENLNETLPRVTVSKAQRRDHASWSSRRLRESVIYKAGIDGVPLDFVDPAYTSQEYPICPLSISI